MLWIKAFHIIFMVCWFAGLFYLPRLFVYHAMSVDNTSKQRFKIMERKLFYGIMTPSMILTIGFGLWLMYGLTNYGFSGGWLHAKLFVVALLLVYHFWCGVILNKFKQDKNTHNHVFLRWMNEVPVLFLFVIIILAVVKPF